MCILQRLTGVMLWIVVKKSMVDVTSSVRPLQLVLHAPVNPASLSAPPTHVHVMVCSITHSIYRVSQRNAMPLRLHRTFVWLKNLVSNCQELKLNMFYT